jgi:hypothetical protein
MIIFKGWFIFSIVAALLVCNGTRGAESKLHYTLEPSAIQPGDRVKFTVRLDLTHPPVGATTAPAIHDDLFGKSERIQILDRQASASSTEAVWTYEFTSYQVGEINLPPVEVQWGSENFSSESQTLKVSSTRPEEDEAVRSEYGEVEAPFPWKRWMRFGGLVLLAILMIAALMYLLRRRQPTPEIDDSGMIPAGLDPLLWLKEQLTRFREGLQSSPQPEHPVDDLALILREYFARSSSNPVETWTTREFQERFSRDEIARRIGEVFEACDQIKFAGDQAPPAQVAARLLDESEKILLP